MVVMVAAFALVQWGNLWMKRVLVLPVVWDLPRQAEALVSIKLINTFKGIFSAPNSLDNIVGRDSLSVCSRRLFRHYWYNKSVSDSCRYSLAQVWQKFLFRTHLVPGDQLALGACLL